MEGQSRVDANAILAFVRVVEAGSFRGAALELGLPKSSVSRKVAELEERLGARLLERTTRRVRLTDVGAAYFRQVAPAVGSLRQAEQMVAELQSEPRGLLRISVPVVFGQLFFGELLGEFLRRYPGVQMAVDLSDRQVDLLKEGYDLVVRAGPLPDSTLRVRRLGASRVSLFASPSYLAARGVPTRPQELAEHDCLVMGQTGNPVTWTFAGPRKPLHVEVRVRAAVNSFFVLRDLAVAGLGIVRLPAFLAERAVREGSLRSVLDGFQTPVAPLQLVYPSGRNLAPKLRALLDFLGERLAEPPWLRKPEREALG